MEEGFDNVVRYYAVDNCQYGYVEECELGDLVMYENYEKLLNAYKELKHRMEGLEK